MSKQLIEMTLQELWQLFPIKLVEHQPYWNGWYQEKKDYLLSIFTPIVQIHHIGSTSIEEIWAKPIIDILVETRLNDFEVIKAQLLNNGYLCMAQDKIRMDFNKGYTPEGFAEKVFHLHLRVYGDNDELYFRDYLKEHSEIAKEYEKLKLSLWKSYENDRDGYTESKTAFVCKYTQEAKKQYGHIY